MDSDTHTTGKGPVANLTARRVAGQVKADPVQEKIVLRLQAVHDQLAAMTAEPPKPGLLARLGLVSAPKPPQGPHGLYIWGPVGRGKSMLMDLFFSDAPVARKRRVHFHEFMLEVHDRLYRRREELAARGAPPEADTIVPVAKAIAAETRLLCFDEFQVTNIADAMILARLFETLFDQGITVIATSNRAPDDLYKDGLQRERFLPFIELLKQKLDILELDDGRDYRLVRFAGRQVYFTPADDKAYRALERAFADLTDNASAASRTLLVQGRFVVVPRAAKNVAWLSFAELCGQPLGPADFLALVGTFHTFIVEGVPKLTGERRDEAKRFSIFIDTLYEARGNLICSADVPPQELYTEGDQSFEFQRAVSRLIEMQSEEYMSGRLG
jgi:cell division protein ZapE